MTELCELGKAERKQWYDDVHKAYDWQAVFYRKWKHMDTCPQCLLARREAIVAPYDRELAREREWLGVDAIGNVAIMGGEELEEWEHRAEQNDARYAGAI